MEYSDWISVAAWALRAAIPVVTDSVAAHEPEKLARTVWRMESDVRRALNPDAD
jgi:hypothetical protein